MTWQGNRAFIKIYAMTRNILMVVGYDGTDFHGWQKQPGVRTVQEEIEQAARRVAHHQVTVLGSGRTDAGVHAQGQVANFETTCEIPCPNLHKAIGGRLPKDITIHRIREVPLGFRATREALSKLYRYTIYNDNRRPVSEHRQRYVYHYWQPLDIDRMRNAARYLVGRHDFAAFASSGSERETTIRTIYRFEVYRHYNEILLDVEGNGFLYNQVRNMVGTLIEIGRGHWPINRMPGILDSRNRCHAGGTAPARGLCLQWVRYNFTNYNPTNNLNPPEPLFDESSPSEPQSSDQTADLDNSP